MSNRSGTVYSAPTDADRRPTLIGVSTADGITPKPVEIDPTSGGVLVDIVAGGGSGGTSATFGNAFPATGTPVGGTNGTDFEPLQLDGSGYLEVNVKAGGGGGTQYQELATTTPATGTLSLGRYSSSLPTLTNGQMNEPMLDSSSRLLVTETNSSTINTSLGTIDTDLKSNITLHAGSNNIGSVEVTDGTNVANVMNATSTSSNSGNALFTAGTGYTTGTISLSAGTQATSWYDLLNYPAFSVEVLTNTTPATLTFQTSGDASETNVRTMGVQDSQNASDNVIQNSTSTTGTFIGSRTGRYFRISSNLAGGNTATLVITFYTTPSTKLIGAPSAFTGSTTGSNVPAAAFYMGVSDQSGKLTGAVSANTANNTSGNGLLGTGDMAQYNSTAPTVTNGDYYALQSDSSGNLKVYLATELSSSLDTITNYHGGNSYTHIAAGQATTVVKASAGILHSITFNGAATATNVTTVYDNASGSGTVIAIPAATAVTTPETVIYDIAFANGLTIITSTANGGDMTISWR